MTIATDPWRVVAIGMGRDLLFIEASEAKAARRRETLRRQGFTTHMEKIAFGEPLERTVHVDAAVFGREATPSRVVERQSQLITIREIAKLLQFSAGHVRDRVVKRPGFPCPAICEARVRRWRLDAVERWILRQEDLSRRGLTSRRVERQ